MPVEELVEEDVEEVDKEVDLGELAPTGDLAPEQAPAPLVTLLVVAGIWEGGWADEVAGRGPAASLRAWGKVPAIQVE